MAKYKTLDEGGMLSGGDMRRAWVLSSVLVLALMLGSVAKAATFIDTLGNISAGGLGAYGCAASYGAGCVKIGDKVFRGLSVEGVNASSVNVYGEQIGDIVYIEFGGPFSSNGPDEEYRLFYDVTSLTGAIEAITQSFTKTGQGIGIIGITEEVFSNASRTNLVAKSTVGCLGPFCDYSDPPSGALETIFQGDDLIISPPLPQVWVAKDIEIDAFHGSFSASVIRQGFKQQRAAAATPEPAHTAFVLGACLAIGLYYRSRKRAQA